MKPDGEYMKADTAQHWQALANEMIRTGTSITEAAAARGCKPKSITEGFRHARKAGASIPPVRTINGKPELVTTKPAKPAKPAKQQKAPSRAKLLAALVASSTLQGAADTLNMTVRRLHRICAKHGITARVHLKRRDHAENIRLATKRQARHKATPGQPEYFCTPLLAELSLLPIAVVHAAHQLLGLPMFMDRMQANALANWLATLGLCGAFSIP